MTKKEKKSRQPLARKRRRIKLRILRITIINYISFLLLFLIAVVFIAAFGRNIQNQIQEKEAKETLLQQQKEQELKLAAEEAQRQENTVHIAAVGDNLIHEKIYKSGLQPDGTYSYHSLYQHIKNDISAADLAIVNEEGIFVQDWENVSAYPDFGTPTEIGDALADAGFDVIQYATNHAYDKGDFAILETLNYWKSAHPEISVLGIHDSQESADRISTFTCKNLSFALLNYTEILNGEDQDHYTPYMIDLLSFERLEQDIPKAMAAADVVIALLHIGDEYSTQPSASQLAYLDVLLEAGVDVTICSHPHILQGCEILSHENGNEMLVYYSLGNFISSQKIPECLLGGMAEFSLYKDPETKEISIEDYTLIPLVTHYNYEQDLYTVYKLSDYTDQLAAEHSIHEESSVDFSMEWLTETFQAVTPKQ